MVFGKKLCRTKFQGVKGRGSSTGNLGWGEPLKGNGETFFFGIISK